MKKILFIALVCVMLLSMAAFAELPMYTPAEDGTYSIGYTEGASGNYYALLVVDGIVEEGAVPTISEDTVLYIDQGTADANGDVSFDNWIPKYDRPATVYLGSNAFTDGPVLLGYLGEEKFVVAGTVTTDSGTSYEATVTLTNADGEVFTTTSVSGAYSIEIPEDTYTFVVNVKNHLSYTDADFAVAENVSGKDVAVKGGDVDADGTVAYSDLASILKNYTTSVEDSDVNGDGVTAYADLATILKNYGENAVSE